MNILYFHQHFSTPQGTSGTRSYEMAVRLVSAGHKVTMVCGSYRGSTTGLNNEFQNGRRTGTVDGIDIIEFKLNYTNKHGFVKRTWLFILFALKSVSVALFTKADLIFATSTPLTAGIPGIVAKWIKGTTFVFEVRDLWPELPREMKVITNPIILKMMSFLEWLSYKSADKLIGLSPGIVAGIKKHNIRDEDVTLIPNGCDIDLFTKKITPYRPSQLTEDDFIAIFTGTHGLANGLDAVLDTAAVLNEKNFPQIKLVLVGQGREKKALMERAEQESLSNVIFLDPIPKDQLTNILAGADIGLQILANIPAFYYGTSPNKFFDYLASGIPVLTNYPGWVADLVKSNECGYAVTPDDPEQFAETLVEAYVNRDELVTMGKLAQQLGEKEFARSKLAEKFVTWLEKSTKNS